MAAGGQVGGYEFKVKGKLPTTCQCLICQELIRECTELPCHHPYCKSCLLRWEEQKREENERLGRYQKLNPVVCCMILVIRPLKWKFPKFYPIILVPPKFCSLIIHFREPEKHILKSYTFSHLRVKKRIVSSFYGRVFKFHHFI